jgi:uncharacterized protein (DUF983 family)
MEKHTCPHCGAIYEVTYTKVIFRDRDTANCKVCGEEMHSWNGSRIPSFRLIECPREGEKDGGEVGNG